MQFVIILKTKDYRLAIIDYLLSLTICYHSIDRLKIKILNGRLYGRSRSGSRFSFRPTSLVHREKTSKKREVGVWMVQLWLKMCPKSRPPVHQTASAWPAKVCG